MIGIEQATCKRCGKPIEIKEIGPNKREWCSQACKQAAYREREKERKVEAAHDTLLSERIAELERQLVEANELIEGLLEKKQSKQPVKRKLQEKLSRVLEQRDWPAFTLHYRVNPGQKNGRVFIIGASVDLLSRALAQLETETS